MTPLRLLFISTFLPYSQVEHAGGMILYQFIRRLASRHQVSLISFARSETEQAHSAELGGYCTAVRTVLYPGAVVESDFQLRPVARLRNMLLERDPFQVRQFRHPAMFQAIQEVVKQDTFDIVQLEFTASGQYLQAFSHSRTVLNEHDVSFVPFQRRYEQERNPLRRFYLWTQWRKMLHYELDICHRVRCVLVPAAHAGEALQAQAPELSVRVVPYGISLPEAPIRSGTQTDEPNLLFLGAMGRPPNAAAMEYFYREVFPLIQRQAPNVRLTIAGSNPPPQIQALAADEAVEVTGFVPDRVPYYARCTVFVAPMLTGGGIIIKVLDAMAMGCPVVTTSIGNEGVAAPPEKALLVADSPQEFAESVVTLLRNPHRRQELAEAGRQFVQSQYSWESIIGRLETVYWELMEGSTCL